MSGSRSNTSTRVPGRRSNSSRAVARPRMPAPTTMTSQGALNGSRVRRRRRRTRDPFSAPWDVIVVGAGILGLATARELLLRRPGTRVLVLEREPDIAAHQTSHNSGVVHAGIYYAPGSLKAQLCTEGRAKLYAYCDEHGVR